MSASHGATTVPAGPIQRAILEYLGPPPTTDETKTGKRGPKTDLAARIWPTMNGKSGPARLRAVLEAKRLSFDLADRILCLIDRPNLWHEDPELAAEYPLVDLGGAHVSPRAKIAPVDISARPKSGAKL